MVVTGSTDRHLKLWSTESGKSEFQLPAEHERPITSAAFSPLDGALLVTASEDGTARLWDVRARRALLRARPSGRGWSTQSRAHRPSFRPTAKRCCTTCDDATIRRWDAGTGKLLNTATLSGAALCAAYANEGDRIIAGDANGRAVILDADTLEPACDMSDTPAPSRRSHFRPMASDADRQPRPSGQAVGHGVRSNGQWPGTAGREWLPDGKEVLTLRYHDRAVTSVAFSPDGRSLLTAGMEGVAVVWTADAWDTPANP